MGKKGQKNKRKTDMKIIFFIILVAAALFIISTYAWFSTQKNISITNLSGIVEVAEGLEVSLDAEKWYNEIKLGTGENELDIIKNAYAGHRNISPKELLPVSTLGLVKGKNLKDLQMMRGTVTNSIKLDKIIKMDEQLVLDEYTDSKNDYSGKDAYPGYFAFDIFLKNSSNINVGTTDILQLNYDSSVQVLESKKSATGLQNTVRVAFAKYGDSTTGVVDVDEDVAENILKGTGAKSGVGSSEVYLTDVAIWEPNSSDHVEYIVNNNNKVTWSSTDKVTYNKALDGDKFKTEGQLPTYALVDDAVGKTINNIYKWDGSETLVQKQKTLQTTKTRDDDFESEDDDDYSIKEGVQNLVNTSDGKDFTIEANKICRIRVYVWLEGQDVDCINYASYGGGIKVNIGLVKGSELGSHGETE